MFQDPSFSKIQEVVSILKAILSELTYAGISETIICSLCANNGPFLTFGIVSAGKSFPYCP